MNTLLYRATRHFIQSHADIPAATSGQGGLAPHGGNRWISWQPDFATIVAPRDELLE